MLTAAVEICNRRAIEDMLTPNSRTAQKHNKLRAFCVFCPIASNPLRVLPSKDSSEYSERVQGDRRLPGTKLIYIGSEKGVRTFDVGGCNGWRDPSAAAALPWQ